MTNHSPMRITTHDGSFHADDVLAVAILTTVFPDHQIIRTRDSSILEDVDIVVDVGDCYDHYLRRYDHHMKNPPVDRFGHMYSSAGLIWKHYGRKYLTTIGIPPTFIYKDQQIDLLEAVEKHVLVHWMNPIDRADNGLAHGPTPISEVVRAMRPINPERSRVRFDALFMEAASMVSHIFKRSCFHSADHVISKTKCMYGDKVFLDNGKIVISEHTVRNYQVFSATDAHFVICPSQEQHDCDPYYIVRPIEIKGEKTYKTPFPSTLLGTRTDVVEQVLNVTGVKYIHHGGFLALTDTLADAIKLCEKLLVDI